MADPIPLRPHAPRQPRKAGTRKALPKAFLHDLAADWAVNGAQTIARVRISDPVSYLRVFAQVVPHLVSRPPTPAAPLTPGSEWLFGKTKPAPPGQLRTPPGDDPMLTRFKEACDKLLPRKPEDVPESELRALMGDNLVDAFFEPDNPPA